MSNLIMQSIPAFSDNYIWILHNGKSAIVVDAGESEDVLNFLQEIHLSLEAIFITHHHNDHTCGVYSLAQKTGAKIYAPEKERGKIKFDYIGIRDGDIIETDLADFKVIDIPAHTLGHTAYYSDFHEILFCGDTLFSGGCGRVFEGDYKQMFDSLSKLAKLPCNTRVYPAHEYTISNLSFATNVISSIKDVNFDNAAILERLRDYQNECLELRSNLIPTLPTTIGKERDINIFLQLFENSDFANLVSQACFEYENGNLDKNDKVAVFTALRKWKNNF